MEYKGPFDTRINFNSEVLVAQGCTHMNGTVFLLHPDLKKKKKKKKDRTTDPPDFRAKRANKRFIF